MDGKRSLLLFCGSLALGEFVASLAPLASGSWPFPLAVAALVALFGYGCDLPCWRPLAAFLLGAALYFGSAADEIERNRARPWMRGHVTAMWRQERTDDLAYRIRRDFARRIALGLDENDETVALGRAILLGEKDDMPPRTKRLFVESGTMHVFAISGLHVMAIADLLSVLLAVLFVPRRFCGILAIPLLWGYVAVIGFPPSAVRAAMMASFSLLTPVFWRKPDGVRSWCLTFLVVHLVNPALVSHVGNALSFAVMLAIVLAGRLGEGMARWKRMLLTTFAAWAAGLPISAHVFGRITPGSMVANLVLIETAKLSVGAGMAGVLASYVAEGIAVHLNNLTALGIRAMVMMAEGVSRLPCANFTTDAWGYVTCAQWYLALALGCHLLVRRARRHRGI